MKLEAKQQAKKAKTKKEQIRIESNFMNFGSKVLKGVLNSSMVDKINTRIFEAILIANYSELVIFGISSWKQI